MIRRMGHWADAARSAIARIAITLALLACLSGAAAADTWRLDPDHTEIRFSWNHMGMSRQSGEFVEPFGRLVFSPTDPVAGRVEVTMLLASLRTGVAKLDAMLRSPDYFDAEQFPRVTFTSTGVASDSPKSGTLNGELTMRGVTRPVSLKARWNFTGEHPLASFNPVYRGKWVTGFSATGIVRRSEWGMTQAIPLVSDQIEITIEAEFIRVD
ncbi:MAG: YceI family protein [Pseudomonadota bacterium]